MKNIIYIIISTFIFACAEEHSTYEEIYLVDTDEYQNWQNWQKDRIDAENNQDTDSDKEFGIDYIKEKLEEAPEGCRENLYFPDPLFQQRIRLLVGKPTEDILYEDVSNIRILNLTDPGYEVFRDLTGIKCLTGLTSIKIDPGEINNIQELTNLNILMSIDIKMNPIADISPLLTCENLEFIELSIDELTDISPLVNNPGIDNGDKLVINVTQATCNLNSFRNNLEVLKSRGVDIYSNCIGI